jgi:ectoine hydroxylase-related dioxygenase (phytanoyl-CoA dioxygenase family)
MLPCNSTRECLHERVIPGSHKSPRLPQRDTGAPDNALSRGQEIAVDVDESQAVDMLLQPGEMSLHHVAIIHGSKANSSNKPRIGVGIRYVTPDVVQDGVVRQFALLVRGRDEFGHFDLLELPERNDPAANAVQLQSLQRAYRDTMPSRP